MLNTEILNDTHVQVYNYNGSKITFKSGNNLMINATQMVKPFPDHKRPLFWLKLQSTHEFLDVLSKVRNLTLTDLVQVTKGGLNPGTWFHEDVAIEFARWLSPSFSIWCNDRVKDIIKHNIAESTRKNDISPSLYDIQVRQARSWQELYYRSQEQLKAMAKNLEGMSELLRASYDRQYKLIASEESAPKSKPKKRKEKCYTIVGYASLTKKKVDRTQASILGRKAAAICRRQGIEPGEVESANFGTVKTYSADILKQVFAEYFG